MLRRFPCALAKKVLEYVTDHFRYTIVAGGMSVVQEQLHPEEKHLEHLTNRATTSGLREKGKLKPCFRSSLSFSFIIVCGFQAL
jgi:hypothetical protein